MSEKVLSLHIRCLSEQAVVTKDVTYKQILFDGSADGPYFTGEILPGGVDTQDGKPAMLYIENPKSIKNKFFSFSCCKPKMKVV